MRGKGALYAWSGQGSALHGERGSTMVLVGLAIAALLGMVALGVDVGMLFTARGEAQRAADSAALAGAAAFIEAPPEVVGDAVAEQRAKDEAIQYASQNNVQEQMADVREEDVVVDLAQKRVTVTVRRIEERGNPVGTWFARVFGVDVVDIAARATAEVQLAGGGTCMKPFTIPDAWADADKDWVYDPGELYVARDHGYGSDYRNGMQNGIDLPDNGVDPIGTTYVNDFGRPIVIHEGKPQEAIISSWYFPWDVPQGNGPDTGADRYRWNIANCNSSVVELGQEYDVENGRMKTPTTQGLRQLMQNSGDEDAYWDIEAGGVVGANSEPWKSSDRVINIPLFDPRDEIEPGKKPVVFNNIVSFWLDGFDKDGEVIGRFLYASGIAVAGDGPGGDDIGNAAQVVRLIE